MVIGQKNTIGRHFGFWLKVVVGRFDENALLAASGIGANQDAGLGIHREAQHTRVFFDFPKHFR